MAAAGGGRELAGVAVAVCSVLLYDAGYVLEKQALGRLPALELRPRSIIATVVSSRRWVAGFSTMVGGLGLQILALTMAPVSVVQPIMAGGLVGLVVAGEAVLGERLGRRQRGALLLVLGAVIAIAVSARAGGTVAHRTPADRFVALAVLIGALGALCAWAGTTRSSRRGAALAGAALGAGMLYGLGALAEKAVATGLVDHGLLDGALRSLATPYPWLFLVATFAGMLVFQVGLQRHPASMVATFSNVASSVCALAGASVIFGELLLPSGWWSLARIAGFAAVLAAIAMLVFEPEAALEPAVTS